MYLLQNKNIMFFANDVLSKQATVQTPPMFHDEHGWFNDKCSLILMIPQERLWFFSINSVS